VLEYKPGKHNAFRIIDSMPFTVAPDDDPDRPGQEPYVPVNCVFVPCVQGYAFKPKGKNASRIDRAHAEYNDDAGIATAPNPLLQGGTR
jgi:hypothetical protein